MKHFLRAKIHRLRVTSVDLNHTGGVVIDQFLLDEDDIVSGEKALVDNISMEINGQQMLFQEKLMVSARGVGAKHCKVGDIITVSVFETSDSTSPNQK